MLYLIEKKDSNVKYKLNRIEELGCSVVSGLRKFSSFLICIFTGILGRWKRKWRVLKI